MKIVIIGNGAASLSAIVTIRKYDSESDITVISKEKQVAYTPCFLAQYVCGEVGKEKLALKDKEFYKDNNVNTILGVSASAIMTDEQKVHLSNGNDISYDQLLLAAGSNPIIPPIPGIGSENVLYFRSITDADKIIRNSVNAKNIVVMGAGFIGLEVAEALLNAGKNVTVVEKDGWILPRMLDKDVAVSVERFLSEKGLKLITGREIKSIESPNGRVKGVNLENGETICCDMLVVSIGVKPNLEMIKNGSIKTGRGITVNEMMRTNVPNIYAAGDIAEIEVNGTKKINPIHINAVTSGEIAGSNIAGVGKKLEEHLDDMNVVTLFDKPILTLGMQKGERIVQKESHKGLVKVHAKKSGQINGVQLVGNVTKGGLYLSLMKKGISIDEIEDIVSSNFNYGSIMLAKCG